MPPPARTGFAALPALAVASLVASDVAMAQGGDGPRDAVVIEELPFLDAGTTVGFTDDLDFVCPYTGSTSPDVFYRLVPPPIVPPLVADGSTSNHVDPACPPGVDRWLRIELCNSGYDTKAYLLDENLDLVLDETGALACNDDFCSSPNGGMFRSRIDCVPFEPERPLYVVVDGWLGDAGDYVLEVNADPYPHCTSYHPCGFWGFFEHGDVFEPDDCAFGDPDPNDQVNGGCNATPPAFTDLDLDVIVESTAWMDCANGVRDTDWWRVPVNVPTSHARLEIEFASYFTAVIGRAVGIDESSGGDPCAGPVALSEWRQLPCSEELDFAPQRTAAFPATTQYLFIAPLDRVDCHQPMGGPPSERGHLYQLRVRVVAEPCPGDLDESGTTGFEDLLAVLANWGDCPGCPEDLTGDGAVGFDDMLLVLSTWGDCP